MPGIFEAAIEAPTPEPHTKHAAVGLAAADRHAELERLVGVVDANRVGVGAEVDDDVAGSLDRLEHGLAQLHAAVVEGRGDLHRSALAPSRASRAVATASAVSPSSAKIRWPRRGRPEAVDADRRATA